MSTNVFPHALTNGAWFIGIPDITEENYKKVYMRYEMARFATEAVVSVPDGNGNLVGRKITLEEVKAHIGLQTGAHSLTDAEWNDRLVEHLSDRAKRSLRYAKENTEGGE